MKRNIISVALFAVLATTAVSCQKENIVEPQTTVAEVGTVRTVSYAVDGVTHQITLHGDEEWDNFIESMMTLSEEGHNVSILNESVSVRPIATKDTQVYTTTDRNEAKAWTKEKGDEGYTVEMSYNNGLYVCVAHN